VESAQILTASLLRYSSDVQAFHPANPAPA